METKQPAVLVLWLRFHNMAAAAATTTTRTARATNVLLIFGYQYQKAKQQLEKVIKCVTACCWSCKFLHAGQKGRQLFDCCNLPQLHGSTASDMQLSSTSIQLSTVTTERQRPLNAAKITQSSQQLGSSRKTFWPSYKSLLLENRTEAEALSARCQAPVPSCSAPNPAKKKKYIAGARPVSYCPCRLSSKCRAGGHGVKII